VKVAAIQHDIVWEDAAATRAHVEPLVAQAATAGAQLVLLTETFATGFSMETDRTAEPEGGPTSEWLADQAGRHGVWVGGSIPERSGGDGDGDRGEGRPHNTFVLAAPTGEQHRYRKLHPFSFHEEDQHFRAGAERITVDVEGMRVTPFVCFDLRFANAFWDMAPATDLYVVVANWPAARRHHWVALLSARAIENQAYVVGVNRVGSSGDGVEHAGDSRIVDPTGELLASAAEVETVLVADLDPERVAAVRKEFPFFADRRSF
jgi:predicted amidohydrolase